MPANDAELIAAVANLPLLRKAKQAHRNEIFCKKLKFCCVLCDFTNNRNDLRLKQVKRQVLTELIDFVDNSKAFHTDSAYAFSTQMFSVNVFRNVPFKIQYFDYMEEEHEVKGWGQLALVYTYFLRFIGHSEFQPSKAKQFFTPAFIQKLIGMFHIDDQNEREHLKTCLHRIYAKFLGMRSIIRKIISNKLLEAAFENVKVVGVPEILEVMGSIINGYIRPYKEEHIQFLQHVLLPLHTCLDLINFHPQLVYCVIQFIEKEETLMEMFVKGLIKRWPKMSAVKESLFLGELEEIMDVMQPQEFAKLHHVIFTQIAKSIRSEHYQVCERALYFWENEYIVSLMEVSHEEIFPILLPSLLHVSNFHWSSSTASLANEVLQKFMRPGDEQFEKIVAKVKKRKWFENKRRQSLNKKWEALEVLAQRNPLCKTSSRLSSGSPRYSLTSNDLKNKKIQNNNPYECLNQFRQSGISS